MDGGRNNYPDGIGLRQATPAALFVALWFDDCATGKEAEKMEEDLARCFGVRYDWRIHQRKRKVKGPVKVVEHLLDQLC
jgi:hypothetical protein